MAAGPTAAIPEAVAGADTVGIALVGRALATHNGAVGSRVESSSVSGVPTRPSPSWCKHPAFRPRCCDAPDQSGDPLFVQVSEDHAHDWSRPPRRGFTG